MVFTRLPCDGGLDNFADFLHVTHWGTLQGKEGVVDTKKPAQTSISVVLGASVLMVVSTDAAAAVGQSDARSAVSAIRQAAVSGEAQIGLSRIDEQGRLRLAQFGDTWRKQWDDRKHS